MELKRFFAQDLEGNALLSANCTVYLHGTAVKAQVFDAAGAAMANPFQSSAVSGELAFMADDGLYDVHVSHGGREYTLLKVPLFDHFTGSAITAKAPVSVIDSSRQLYIGDSGIMLDGVNASPITVIVTSQDTVQWEDNTEVHMYAENADITLVAEDVSVTVLPPAGGSLIVSAGMCITLKRLRQNVWAVIGATVPA